MLIKTVNGYEIMFVENSIEPYHIRYGRKFNQVYCFKTLKSAEKWAVNN